jgi:hypothetical protein
VLVHVRAEPRRTAVHGDLPRQAGFHQRIKAIINRGVRDLRHRLFRPDENLLGGRMIALLHQHVIDLLPLGRQAQTGRPQLLGQVLVFGMAARFHRSGKI